MSEENGSNEVDFSHDSVRLVSDNVRVKAIIIMDVTELTEGQQKKFVNRSLAALTRMGKKVMSEKDA